MHLEALPKCDSSTTINILGYLLTWMWKLQDILIRTTPSSVEIETNVKMNQ